MIKWADREGLPPRLINRSSALYRTVNSVVRDVLSTLGFRSYFVPESAAWSTQLDCFSNPCAYDIVYGGKKIYGAAQLRVGRAFLYQGNLLLENGIGVDDFGRLLLEGLRKKLGWDIVEGELSTEELEEAEKLCHIKYASNGWNRFGRYPSGRPMRPVARILQ